MKFDLVFSPFGTSVPALVSAAEVAEAVGFDAVWTYDHISGASGDAGSSLDPWIVLTAMASVTDRIGLGPLVLNASIRHPSHIAVASASLQDLSDGRLMLGMGAGAGADRYGVELAMVGLPRRSAAERRARTEEAIRAVKALWSGEEDVDAVHYPLRGARAFLRPDPVPPVVVGANGPKMAALAGRTADALNVHWFENDLERLAATARTTADDPSFPVTVEAPLEAHWLTGGGRSRLERLGVTRIMFQWHPRLGVHAIERAARDLAIT